MSEQQPLFSRYLLTTTECHEIISRLEQKSGWRIAGGASGNTRVNNLPDDLWTQALALRIQEVVNTAWPYTIDGVQFSEAALVRYCTGAIVPKHTDVNPVKRSRVFSFIVYLTSGFRGGELHIPSLGYAGVAPLGWITVFPSTELHWAEEVIAGDKSVLVGFLTSC